MVAEKLQSLRHFETSRIMLRLPSRERMAESNTSDLRQLIADDKGERLDEEVVDRCTFQTFSQKLSTWIFILLKHKDNKKNVSTGKHSQSHRYHSRNCTQA